MENNQQKLKPLKLVPVPRLLDHIGLAMYSKFTKAIGELVVNGYDADATRVDVDIKSDEITIKDDGSGMDECGIRDGYMLLGADKKRRIRKTPKFNRLPVGNKGIGKLAGLGIANKISVYTIKDNKEYSFSIDREEFLFPLVISPSSSTNCPCFSSGNIISSLSSKEKMSFFRAVIITSLIRSSS